MTRVDLKGLADEDRLFGRVERAEQLRRKRETKERDCRRHRAREGKEQRREVFV